MSENRFPYTPLANGGNPDGRAVLPPSEKHSVGWKIWQVLKTIQARLRFFVLLAAVGALIVYWEPINAVYEKWTRSAAAQEAADADSEFWCPMHPTIVRDHPDKCPICGMPLSKRKKNTGEAEALPPGVVSRVQLTPLRVAYAGIRTEPVEYRPLTRQIEAAGFVEFDETKLTRITNRISGRSRIDKLYVNVTDQTVNEGDPLALLYSPDLDTTMQNLLDARRGGNKELERMTRERLQLWGIGGDQIDEVVKTGKPITHVTIRSPAAGHVLRKYQLEGDYIDEGARLFDVADLSTVWIEAQVFEDELAFLKPGLVVHAFPKAYPNREFTGKIDQVHPHLDAETRTLKVRFDVDNPGHLLRPGMYAAVKLDVPATDLTAAAAQASERQADRAAADVVVHALFAPSGQTAGSGLASLVVGAGDQALLARGRSLAVPQGAVIDTGSRKVVYREAGPSLYEGVEVELGPRLRARGGFYPVVRGPGGGRPRGDGRLVPDRRRDASHGWGRLDLLRRQRRAAEDRESGRGGPALGDLRGRRGGGGGDEAARPGGPKGRRGTGSVPGPEDAARLDGRAGQGGCSRGLPVFLCCPLCVDKANKDPQGMLDKVDQLKAKDAPPAK